MADSKKLKRPTMASAACKKHQKHKQSPGICAVCLTEKLSKIANNTSKSSWRSSTKMADSSSSSSSSSSLSSVSSYYSSSASSSSSSPLHGLRHLTTTTLFSGKPKLTQSRSSMPFFPRFRGKEEGGERKSNGGIWSTLIGRWRRKRTREALKHNKTVRERACDTIIAIAIAQ